MGLRGKTIIWLGVLSLCSLLLIGGITYYQGANLAINQLLETTEGKIEKDSAEIKNFVEKQQQT